MTPGTPLRTVRAFLLKESFQCFWAYKSATWAGWFLDKWCTRVMRSQLAPMKRVAKTLRAHRALLLNWFKAKGEIALGVVEGLNGNAKLAIRKGCGSFRTARTGSNFDRLQLRTRRRRAFAG